MQPYSDLVTRTLKNYAIVISITMLILIGSPISSLNAQSIYNKNTQITSEQVHTVLFHRKGWDLSFPAYHLRSDDKILLRFDIMGSNVSYLDYTIYQYDANWTKKNTFREEYLSGFAEQAIENYANSVNTVVEFMNYSIEIPNDQLQITQSGNYELVVYESGNPANIYLTRRFLVYEQACSISGQLNRFDSDNYEGTCYFDATVNPSELRYQDIHQQIIVASVYNNDWNKLKYHDNYRIAADGEMIFEHTQAISYPGGNEYRMFSFKSLKQPSERVAQIDFNSYEYRILLKNDTPRDRKPYFVQEDFNGLFVIDTDHGWDNPHLESDYGKVKFSFNLPQPLLSNVYIYGALTNWSLNDSNVMQWNPDLQQYEGELLLKQGFYNYRYLAFGHQSDEIDWSNLEGSFTETESILILWVYYRDFTKRHDRLVGYEIIPTHR